MVPGKIVREVVDRPLIGVGIRDALAESLKIVPGLIGVAQRSLTFANEAIAKAVHQCRGQNGGIADDQPLVEVDDVRLRSGTGEKRRARRIFVGQGARDREAMPRISRDVVIQFRNVPVLAGVSGRVETVACGVERISQLRLVRKRILTHVLQNGGIGPMRAKAGAVPGSDCRRSNGHIATERRVRSAAKAQDRVTNRAKGVAAGIVGAAILNYAVAHCRRRHDARLAECFGVTIAFEIHEEEQTILQDGAAQRCSEDVAVQLRGTIGLATLKLSRLDEIVVGADERVAVVFVH